MEKIKGFQEFINESIDIYTMDELESNGVYIEVREETDKSMEALFSVSGYFYKFKIMSTGLPFLAFGNSDDFGQELEMDNLLNRDISRFVLSIVFSLLRYWVDKYEVKALAYMVKDDGIRQPLYQYYLDKHFSDFDINKEVIKNGKRLKITLTRP
jgi:hypothetical protein